MLTQRSLSPGSSSFVSSSSSSAPFSSAGASEPCAVLACASGSGASCARVCDGWQPGHYVARTQAGLYSLVVASRLTRQSARGGRGIGIPCQRHCQPVSGFRAMRGDARQLMHATNADRHACLHPRHSCSGVMHAHNCSTGEVRSRCRDGPPRDSPARWLRHPRRGLVRRTGREEQGRSASLAEAHCRVGCPCVGLAASSSAIRFVVAGQRSRMLL